ncbi:hypothetical protein F5148DRAFT_1159660 [Russula earlei]|uniref:Uncharacterized protein n=1 Tax=Russula earlei TaxID=71964 RepID=A0ACC0UPH3_9AGAM|nr:hypothetical protein F5148DRAFT_1159660 [Russula earlei]
MRTCTVFATFWLAIGITPSFAVGRSWTLPLHRGATGPLNHHPQGINIPSNKWAATLKDMDNKLLEKDKRLSKEKDDELPYKLVFGVKEGL